MGKVEGIAVRAENPAYLNGVKRMAGNDSGNAGNQTGNVIFVTGTVPHWCVCVKVINGNQGESSSLHWNPQLSWTEPG